MYNNYMVAGGCTITIWRLVDYNNYMAAGGCTIGIWRLVDVQ